MYYNLLIFIIASNILLYNYITYYFPVDKFDLIKNKNIWSLKDIIKKLGQEFPSWLSG